MSSGRRKEPSHNTLIHLWTSSGGRCQFEGCNCKVFCDDLTGHKFNAANVAHIIAASPNGPRGNAHSEELSNQLDNLMLLCPIHHKEVDSFPDKYPPSRLRGMKARQEQQVQELLDCMYYPKSEIIILESPIKGKVPVHVDNKQTIEAVRGIQKNPANAYPILLKPTGIGEYRSPEYWAHMETILKQNVEIQIKNRLEHDPSIMLAVFPQSHWQIHRVIPRSAFLMTSSLSWRFPVRSTPSYLCAFLVAMFVLPYKKRFASNFVLIRVSEKSFATDCPCKPYCTTKQAKSELFYSICALLPFRRLRSLGSACRKCLYRISWFAF